MTLAKLRVIAFLLKVLTKLLSIYRPILVGSLDNDIKVRYYILSPIVC